MQKPKVNRERKWIYQSVCDIYDDVTIANVLEAAYRIDKFITPDQLVVTSEGYDNDYSITFKRLENDKEYTDRIKGEEDDLREWEKQEVIREAKRKIQKKKDVEREIALLETRLTELKLHGTK